MMKNIKHLFFLPGVMAIALFMILQGCKKTDKTYYEYENKIQEFDGNALSYLQAQNGIYDSMLVVLKRLPHLEDSLKTKNLTVFAVTNKSFETAVKNLNTTRKAQNKKPISLAEADLAQLDTMMCKYLVREKFRSEDFQNYSDGAFVKSLKFGYPMHILYTKASASGLVNGGPQILTYSDPRNSIFVKFWQRSPTNAVNIATHNSIIHVVAPGHEFGFNDFTTRINK
ncbi:fasciclin domain-containing protein [Pedobacter caeni]|nr:fasciclin domain-containing protein [Pedobacter caeni]